MMQNLIVGIIVAAALWSVITHFAPHSLRQFLRLKVARLAHRFGWAWLERKLIVTSLTSSARSAACGTCNACDPLSQENENCSSITPEMLRRTIRR
jgi:hypothetical protein